MSNVEQRAITYGRRQAANYAKQHYNRPNPEFANMDTLGSGGDCTNFTSQCLLAGGMQMDYRQTGQETEWWYRRIGTDELDTEHDDWWSCTWSLPENQYRYLVANQGQAADLLATPALAKQLQRGDIIYYDWHGEGRFTHSAIVTAFNRYHVPYVTYRTLKPRRPRLNVHWRLRFRGEAYRIFGVHLRDELSTWSALPDFTRLIPCDQARAEVDTSGRKM